MQYAYPCNLIPDREEGEGFIVTFPDVPGAITGAQTREESLFLAEDALVAMLAVYVQQQREIPTPSPVADGQELVAVPPIAAAKLALYTAMREQGITGDALAIRLNLNDSAIRKLLDPDCYSHISQIMRALRNVGRSLVIEDRAA
ncbi:MAG: type II toxin-antitoxin system HicB family antitoxin [Gemmatimonadota bacterium]|nr:type II toxin-antitoxin system HicB family antitoxin [Gemmatimonadota bacterium]MDE2829744.1 type II toxin-antitoxin system HicB family antitoxin [Gemmatimonadota bacterium]MDE2953371.1 type II toxin-antitoxin system HicB family antitoxin [Gemmatimonadota bacterium]